MLVCEPTGWLYPDARQQRQFFKDKLRSQYQNAQKLVKKLPLQGEIATVSQQFHDGAVALALLHKAGQVEWIDPFHYRKYLLEESRVIAWNPTQDQMQSQMTQYFTTSECRWHFLLKAFGFSKEADKIKCGSCDNCLKR